MSTRLQILRSTTAGNRPASKQYGEPYFNAADKQFGVFDSTNNPMDLIGVPMFSTSTSYAVGNVVNYQGSLYMCIAAVSPGAWNSAQWSPLVSAASAGSAGSLIYITQVPFSSSTNHIDYIFNPSDPYDEYYIEVMAASPAADDTMYVQLQTASGWGTTYQNSSSLISNGNGTGGNIGYTGTGYVQSGAIGIAQESPGTPGIVLGGTGSFGNKVGATIGWTGHIRIHSISANGFYKSVTFNGFYRTGNGTVTAVNGGGWLAASNTTPITGIRIINATQNFVAGALRVWGIRTNPGSGTPAAFAYGGVLRNVDATHCSFNPFNGNYLLINGASYALPATGVAGLTNTACFINGVSGNLAASTLYYVYAFNNAGVVTADFSTTGHAVSSTPGNIGTEIKSGDDTRSLIGMIRTNASSQFVDTQQQRFVRSWFNNQYKQLDMRNSATAQVTAVSTNWADITPASHIEFLMWANEKVSVSLIGECYSASGRGYATIGWDGAMVQANYYQVFSDMTAHSGMAMTMSRSDLAEGYHYATWLGATSLSTTYYGAASGPYIGISGAIG